MTNPDQTTTLSYAGDVFQPWQTEFKRSPQGLEIMIYLRTPEQLHPVQPLLETIKPPSYWQAIAYSPGSALKVVFRITSDVIKQLEAGEAPDLSQHELLYASAYPVED